MFGAGSWGTALAVLAARAGHPVRLWARRAEHARAMARERANTRFLPGVPFPDGLEPATGLDEALSAGGIVLLAVPSAAFREVLALLAERLEPGHRLAWATKGFEPATGRLLHAVCDEVTGGAFPAAVISGPTFAREVAAGLPAAVTIASADTTLADDLARLLHGPTFRTYTSEDVAGVEVGGALKNVLAIAAGIADGFAFGANARAALVTRGLAEMVRFGLALGGRRETFMGLAGLGDLVLTCTDDQSRNRRLGLALAGGADLSSAIGRIGQVVEGVPAAAEVMRIAERHGLEMPIAEQVHAVLTGLRTPRQAVGALLTRPPRSEAEAASGPAGRERPDRG